MFSSHRLHKLAFSFFLVFIAYTGVCQEKPILVRQISQLQSHGEFSFDDKVLVTIAGVSGNSISLWETRTGRLLKVMGNTNSGYIDVHFSSDGKYVGALSKDGSISIWSLKDFSLFRTKRILIESVVWFKKFSFIPSSSLLLLQIVDSKECLIYDYSNDSIKVEFNAAKSNIIDINISSDGKKIVTSCENGQTLIWKPDDGSILKEISFAPNSYFNPIKNSISTNGKLLAVMTEDQLQVIDIGSGTQFVSKTFPKRSTKIGLDFTPDNKYLVYFKDDGIYLLDVERAEADLLYFTENTDFIAIDGPLNQVLFSGGDGDIVLDLKSKSTSNFFDDKSKSSFGLKFSHNGEMFYSGIRLSNVTDKGGGNVSINYKYDAVFGNAKTHETWYSLSGINSNTISGCGFKSILPEHTLLTTNGILMDYESQKVDSNFAGEKVVLFKPAGIFSVISKDSINFYNIKGLKKNKFAIFNNRSAVDNNIFNATFSDDLKYAFTNKNNLGILWNIPENKIISTFKHRKKTFSYAKDTSWGEIKSIIFSPDSKLLAFQEKYENDNYGIDTIRVFDIRKKQIISSRGINLFASSIRAINGDNSFMVLERPIGNQGSSGPRASQINIIGIDTNKSSLNPKFYVSGEYITSIKRPDGTHSIFFLDGSRLLFGLWDFEKSNNKIIPTPALGTIEPTRLIVSYKVGIPYPNQIIYTSNDDSTRIANFETGGNLNTYNFGGEIIDCYNNHLLLMIDNTGYYMADLLSGKKLYYIALDIKGNFLIKLVDGYFYSSSKELLSQYTYTYRLSSIGFEQLDVKYNRPDKVLEAIGNADTALINAFRRAYYKRIQKLNIDTSSFEDGYSVPEADFVNRYTVDYLQTTNKFSLHIKATDGTYNLDRFNVWINEVPIFGSKGISIRRYQKKYFDTTLIVILSQGENRIETSVTNVNGAESYRIPLFVKYTPAVSKKETVYFIGIGINRFANASHNLQYCAKDIRDLALKFKERYGSSLQIDTLFDENVTIDKVKAIKQTLLQSNEDDKVIIAYSGHGLLSKDYDYFLSTYNVNFSQPEQNGLPYDELENLVDGIKARKKLMLIDACHSGEIDKDEMKQYAAVKDKLDKAGVHRGVILVNKTNSKLGLKNSFELMQQLFVNVGRGTGTTIISAASGTQYAIERGGNGVFTSSVIELLKPGQIVTVNELKKHVISQVSELTQGLQQPTTRNEIQNVDWTVW